MNMDFTFHQLKIFLKITQTLSITKSAEELHLTQPAVSIQFKNFQDQFDIPLIEIHNKKVYVTDFGRQIASFATSILNDVENIKIHSKSYMGLLTGKLNISIVSTGKYLMPYYLTGFLKEHPAIELNLDVTNRAKVIESLSKNEVDFSLVSVLPTNLQLNTYELIDNNLFLVGNKSIENLNSDEKNILENNPLIFREEGSATRKAMEEYLIKKNVNILKKIELTSNEAVKQAVISGMGVSIMPIIGIKNELRNNELKILPMEDLPIITKWYLVWLSQKKLTPVAIAYLKYLKEKSFAIGQSFEKFTTKEN